MKPTTLQLLNLLKTRQFYLVDLFTFSVPTEGYSLPTSSFLSSQSVRYCAGDADVKVNGVLYPAGGAVGPYFNTSNNRFKLHQKIGLETDTFMFDVVPGTAEVFGAPFLEACRNGGFDGGTVRIDRAFMPTYGDTAAGVVPVFVGRIGEIAVGRSVATFTINSWLEQLNSQFPRNLYQARCLNNLGDTICRLPPGFTLPQLAVTTTIASSPASSSSVLFANISNALAGYFDLGKVYFNTGVLAGQSRSIRSCSFGAPGTINLLAQMPTAPAPGDEIFVFPGCDKSPDGPNGCPKFNNVPHFRGFPFVPAPETAI